MFDILPTCFYRISENAKPDVDTGSGLGGFSGCWEGKAAPMLRKFCSTGGRCAVKEKPALLWVEVLITVAGLKEFDLSAGISEALPTKPSSSFSSLFGVNPKCTL